MISDLEAEQVGDQSETVFPKLQIKWLQETVKEEFPIIILLTGKVTIYAMEIDSMIWNQKNHQISMITL